MRPLKNFDINTVSRRLNGINAKISLTHNILFPCLVLLSNYQFKKRFVKIMPNGDIQGGFVKMIISLIDFSFIRCLTASRYTIKSPPAYDPVSLFLLELFRYIDRYQSMDQFLEVLRDKDRSRAYRTYAGLQDHIPTSGTFTNFKARLGVDLYNEIFHILVDIFHQLEMITFQILAHDGTLYPTRARYKGCTYFAKECSCIHVEEIISRVKRQVMYRLNNLSKIQIDKEFRIKFECPSVLLPEKIKRSKIEVVALKLAPVEGKLSLEQANTALAFGVSKELLDQKLCIKTVRSNITSLNLCDNSAIICCPKIPKDTDARIGVRRDPRNPSKKQKIFGYNLLLSTSVELDLKLELPVAVTNIAGNGEEGSMLIVNNQQVYSCHQTQSRIDIADAKYDINKNYEFLREKGSIPIIDYNRRREKITTAALHKRGYDQNGWPYAPCGILTKPNGFDAKHQRHTFCCFKQCLKMKVPGIKNLQADYDLKSCQHLKNRLGYSRHMYIKDHPRLQNQIPRGTKRYDTIKRIRSASERANSTIKEDIKILDKPIVYNKFRADILAQIAAIVLLIHRAMAFIVRTTILLQKIADMDDPETMNEIINPCTPKSIRSLLQLE